MPRIVLEVNGPPERGAPLVWRQASAWCGLFLRGRLPARHAHGASGRCTLEPATVVASSGRPGFASVCHPADRPFPPYCGGWPSAPSPFASACPQIAIAASRPDDYDTPPLIRSDASRGTEPETLAGWKLRPLPG